MNTDQKKIGALPCFIQSLRISEGYHLFCGIVSLKPVYNLELRKSINRSPGYVTIAEDLIKDEQDVITFLNDNKIEIMNLKQAITTADGSIVAANNSRHHN